MWVSSLNHITKKYKIYLQVSSSYNNTLGGGLQTSGLFLLSVPNYQLMLPLWEWLYMLQLPGFGPNNLSVANTLYSTNQFSGDQQNSNGSGGLGFYDFQQQLQYNTFLDLYNTASFNAHKIDAINAANNFNPKGLISDTFRSMYYGKDGKQNKNVFGNLSTLRLNKKDAERTLEQANTNLENAQLGDDIDALGKAQNDAEQAVADANKELKQGRAAAAGAGLNMAGDILKAVLPDRPEYDSPNGQLTLTLDLAYDKISSAVSSFGPWGLLAGGIMNAGAGVGKLMGNIGGGTDGMCVCAGTKVFTSCGKLINIEDLKQEDGILGWDENSKLVIPQEIQNIITPTYKECVEITLKSGLILRCSSDHPILSDNKDRASMKVINGKRMGVRQWKFRPANELKIGNFVALANNIDYWGNKELPNAYLVGLLIGDGTYTKTNSCRLWTADKSTWEYLENNNLGIINNCVGSKKYNTEVRTYRIINGMGLMRQLGLVYLQGIHKTLPTNIGDYSKDSICKLLAGLFDADGSFSINNNSKYSIDLYLTNLSLLEEIRIQLHKLGIFCTIQRRKECNYIINGRQIHSKESYALNIAEKYSIIKFYENIPLNIEYKKEKLKKIYNCVCALQRYKHYLISGAKLSKIIAIKSIGILIVYNLTTSPNHTYLANGIITHNTKTDAIMGSSFMNLTPWGLVNGFGGKKADTFTKDNDAFALVGSSYTGTNALADKALERSGKKYGLFSSHQRGTANRQIAEAKRQLNVVSNISDTALKRNNLRGSMSAIRSNQRAVRRQGGYKQAAMRSGREGLLISPSMAGRIARVPILLLLGGGIHKSDNEHVAVVDPDYIYRLVLSAIDLNPLFIQRLLSTPTLYVIVDSEGHPGSHLLSSSGVYGYEIVYPQVQGKDGELVFISDPREARRKALESGDYVRFNSVDDAELFTKHYKEYFPEFMEAFYKLVDPYVDEEGRIDQEKVKNTKKEKGVTKHKLGGDIELLYTVIYPVDPLINGIIAFKEGGEIIVYPTITPVDPTKDVAVSSLQEGGEMEDIDLERLMTIQPVNPLYDQSYDVREPEASLDDQLEQLQEQIQDLVEDLSLAGTPMMQNGGEINIIPDGALHKELHHMDDPNGEWTRKGIPVVDAEGNQVAEIEKSEVILRKELIETLEEYTKKYYDKDATKEEKGLLALDSGILLVNEILYNTEDRTNKLL